MVDAALVQACADSGLKPAIVEKFIEQAGSPDPLAITVRSGTRVILVPRPSSPDAAMELVRQYAGKAIVRVGVTQYPAGLGMSDVAELKPDLLDACANVRMGTSLFAKVYRIVTKWYGSARNEAFDDAIDAWKSGYFEGIYVFTEPDPGEANLAVPHSSAGDSKSHEGAADPPTPRRGSDSDPNKADTRVDLSKIGGRSP
ncbi:TraH family protein [Chelatococcus asaccharovorans]|uniref:TraH family protein n=1 Tax=Chelatococcus asaccharovorans TaxID=28210 RepID=UPI00224C67BA|nr:TraH family protein [Chelatococcus asaccharovorans]CAH1660854.1 Conjugal transfer protein TraH [Chelatococcus asaccharovorans]CAH1690208.1 Conjugal transfer protein TraH [Chelatococcus asaccharovorans]